MPHFLFHFLNVNRVLFKDSLSPLPGSDGCTGQCCVSLLLPPSEAGSRLRLSQTKQQPSTDWRFNRYRSGQRSCQYILHQEVNEKCRIGWNGCLYLFDYEPHRPLVILSEFDRMQTPLGRIDFET